MNDTIYVALCIDRNFVQHCAATISSISRSYQGNKDVIIYIVHNDLTSLHEQQLKDIVCNHHLSIEFIKFNDEHFKRTMPIGGGTISDAISLSTYYRIAFAQIMPPKVHRLIYLDADVYVNKSIDELWETDMTGYAIAGVPEPETSQNEKRLRLSIPEPYLYVNSGVSVMNLDEMRRMDYTNKAIEYARINHNLIVYHDQDIANALLYDKTTYLSYQWNMVDCYLYKKPPLSGKALNEVITYRNIPSIIHFAGYLKPWHKECQNPYRNLYWKALQNTPWENSPKQFREKTWFKELKLIIKLILKRPTYFKR